MTRARDVADTQENLGGGVPPFVAGKNKIINGDFRINQRAFTSVTTISVFTFDRWKTNLSGGTVTYTPQTFTLGAAPVVGYEGSTYLQIVTSGQSAAGDFAQIVQPIESVRTFAGQTVTMSFWAKAATGTPKIATEFSQWFGSGGSPSSQFNTYGGQVTLSTSWARYSVTVAIPSISGKTLGTDNADRLEPKLWFSAGSTFDSRTGTLGVQNNTFSIWGVQVEAGNVATPFTTATGTIQGELAACQRYFYAAGGDTAYDYFGTGFAWSASYLELYVTHPVKMRVAPTLSVAGTFQYYGGGGTGTITLNATQYPSTLGSNVEFNASGLNAGQGYMARANNNTATRLNWSAEL